MMPVDEALALAAAHLTERGIRGGLANALVVAGALARGLDVGPDRHGRVRLSDGSRAHWFNAGRTDFNEALAFRVAKHKEVTSALLRSQGVAAPRNAVFATADADQAWQWALPLLPVVLKPSNTKQGEMVHIGITTKDEFEDAFATICGDHGRVLVEEFVAGVEHRVLVIDGQVTAVTRRMPAHVVGDGLSTVADLVRAKNLARVNDPIHAHLELDGVAQALLTRQGLVLSSVPDVDQEVKLRSTSNIHTGGDAVDATDELTGDEIAFVERAAKVLSGLRLGGYDILLPRAGVGREPSVLEVNGSPMIAMHHFPARGRPRDVVGPLLDAMFATTDR